MLERDIEAYLVKRCKEIGALADKFVSPQRRSVPDRLITFGGRVLFVELKATGKKPTEAQVRDHERRRAAGAEVVWLDSIEGVERIMWHLGSKGFVRVNQEFQAVPL
ncbi:VRR-NUC domain protein [compost metagenome]